jgi:hyperosmotically inducible periplasmic protein
MRGMVKQARSVVLLLSLAAGASGVMKAQDQQPAAPDNTKQNKTEGMTADNQKENKADRVTSQKIRKLIMADKSLSSYAHNVKVITTNGTVTLKGPVRSDEEKSAIEAKATEVAGAGNVTSELTVAPKN